MSDTRPQNARGISTVIDVVQGDMKIGWQEISQINDNGIDGIIIDRKKGVDTGDFYYVQVKCGNGYLIETKKRKNKFIEINLGHEYIKKHRKRWNLISHPVILIYVEDKKKDRKSWWVDLKNESTYCEDNKNIILLDRTKRFGEHSIGEIRKLRTFNEIDKDLPIIYLKKDDLIVDSITKPLKYEAKKAYKKWKSLSKSKQEHPRLGEIIVSRVGWRHITRKGRGAANIFQSFTLIGAAKKIIQSDIKAYQIRQPDVTVDEVRNITIIHDYLSLRCKVGFPNRHEAVVQVVLKRLRTIDMNDSETTTKLWFYSVYEPRRHKKTYRHKKTR